MSRKRKKCPKCGVTKTYENFHKNRSTSDGRQTYCKPCLRTINSKWKRDNQKRVAATNKAWQSRNREKLAKNARRFAERNPERVRETTRKQRRLHPEKHRARVATERAVRRGDLVKPGTCEQCGDVPTPTVSGRSSIHAHHMDYSHPLDVVWVCRGCHAKIHSEGAIG